MAYWIDEKGRDRTGSDRNAMVFDHLRLLQAAVASVDSGITIVSMSMPDQPLIFVNQGFLDMTGYVASEVLGKNCRFLQRDEKDQAGIAEIRRLVSTGESGRVLIRNFRKSGIFFWNELYLTPIKSEQGRVTHFVGVQHDVTRVKELESMALSAKVAAAGLKP